MVSLGCEAYVEREAFQAKTKLIPT
jgi:hypothetical protein